MSREVNDEQLLELQAICRRASQGPWTLSQDPGHEALDAIYSRDGSVVELDSHYFGGPDAELICATPVIVSGLVEELLRLRSTGAERARRDHEELARLDRLWTDLGSDGALRKALAALDLSPWSSGSRGAMWLGRRQLLAIAATCSAATPAPWHWRYSREGAPQALMHADHVIAGVGRFPPSNADAELMVATRLYVDGLVGIVINHQRLLRRLPGLRRETPDPRQQATGSAGSAGSTKGMEREIRRARRRLDEFSSSLNRLGELKGPREDNRPRPVFGRAKLPPGM